MLLYTVTKEISYLIYVYDTQHIYVPYIDNELNQKETNKQNRQNMYLPVY